ncbi:MAG: hypothetical protein WD467_02845 [Candidatus Saccharimonadales bacterium]
MAEELEAIDQYKREIVIDYCQPMQFDPEAMQFIVGSGTPVSIPLDGFTRSPDLDLTLASEVRSDPEKADEHLVLDTFGNVVVLPPLHAWLRELSADESRKGAVERDTASLIGEVYTFLVPDDSVIPVMGYDHMSFGAAINQRASFCLITLGDCTCLGPEGSSRPDDGYYQEYSFHNIFNQAQMISLYAGAGYLSWLSRQ